MKTFIATATRKSDIWVDLIELNERLSKSQAIGPVVVKVRRIWAKKPERSMVCQFSPGKSVAAHAILVGLIGADEKGEQFQPFSLAVLADAIEEDDAWQSPAKELRWFLDQLRLAAGLKLAKA